MQQNIYRSPHLIIIDKNILDAALHKLSEITYNFSLLRLPRYTMESSSTVVIKEDSCIQSYSQSCHEQLDHKNNNSLIPLTKFLIPSQRTKSISQRINTNKKVIFGTFYNMKNKFCSYAADESLTK